MTDVIADPFEDLLAETKLEEKVVKSDAPEWEGPIPASATRWAQAVTTPKDGKLQKALIKVSADRKAQLVSAIRAAAKLSNPELSITARDTVDKDGNYTGISVTAGERRGRKA